MIKGIAFTIIFLVLIIGFVLIIDEQTKDWRPLNEIIVEKNVTANEVTKPVIRLNFEDRAPVLEFVSATEYTKGDGNGSTIVKLVDYKGDKINTTCYEKILYPNKTTYVDWVVMVQQTEYSNYYLDFVVPESLGVYDQEVRCVIGSKNISIGKGFHVGNLSNIIDTKIDELKQDVMTVMD